MSSLVISSRVSIEPREIAYCSSPSFTMRACIMARVRGSLTINVLPSPSFVLTSTSPPRASILDFTTSRPTPLPDTSVIFSDVEKLGRKSKSIISLSVIASACSDVIVPFSIALLRTFSTSIPLPSSPTSMTTLLPS